MMKESFETAGIPCPSRAMERLWRKRVRDQSKGKLRSQGQPQTAGLCEGWDCISGISLKIQPGAPRSGVHKWHREGDGHRPQFIQPISVFPMLVSTPD